MKQYLATPATDPPHHDTFNETLDREQSLKPWPDLSNPHPQTDARHKGKSRMRQTENQPHASTVAKRLRQHEDPSDQLA